MKRCCLTCRHHIPEEKACYEGGFSEIGDPERELTEEDCNAYQVRLEELEKQQMLTVDEIEEFGDRLEIFFSQEEANEFAQRAGGQAYTQLDSDLSDDVVYDKGWHLVNRTGVYAVVESEL